MRKLILLVLWIPVFAACTNESAKTHELMISRYFKAAVHNTASLQIHKINTHSEKRTAYTSVIDFQYTNEEGRQVNKTVTLETVGTNKNYIVVNGDCINTEHLAYELNDNAPNTSATPLSSGNSRQEMNGNYLKRAPENPHIR